VPGQGTHGRAGHLADEAGVRRPSGREPAAGRREGAIAAVRVFLTHSGASAFELVVDDPDLRWQAKPTFTDCKEVKIELGVPGKMKKVFDGK